jgi:hypothetical protein
MTIGGINREFVVITESSYLNRWLHDCRLAWVLHNPKTRNSPRGISAIDHTLVSHAGTLIDDVDWLLDYAGQRIVHH